MILNPLPLTTPPHLASKWDNPTTTLFLPICNFRAHHTTLSPSTEATTDYRNATDVNSMDTLNKTATLHYGHSYSVTFASGNGLLKTIVLTSTCPQSPLKPLEVTFLTTKTLKTQKTQIIVDKTTVIHRKSQVWDPWRIGEGNVTNMCSPYGCLTFLALLLHLYLIPIKHAFTLHYKHVDHAIFTSLYPHGIYLYKLVSRVLCSLPSL